MRPSVHTFASTALPPVVPCRDITNTQVDILGETVPEGGNLRIY